MDQTTLLEDSLRNKTSGNVRLEGDVIGDISSSSKIANGETSFVDINVTLKMQNSQEKFLVGVTVKELLILKSTAKIHVIFQQII